MSTVNRALLIARPLSPFVEWVAAQAELTVAEARAELDDDRPAYLIPCFSLEHDLDGMLDELCEEIFACELARWSEDEARWPAERSLASFKQWFAVDLHPVVHDLGDANIVVAADCGEVGA